MIVVEKIGGTSIIKFQEVLDNVILNKKNFTKLNFPYNRIFIISAYSGVTNQLLEHKKTKEKGVYQKFIQKKNFHSSLHTVLNNLKIINKGLEKCGLDVKVANGFIEERVTKVISLLKDLESVLTSGYVMRENILLATREILASIGEVHAAFNSANILQSHGYQAKFIDLSGFGDPRHLTIDKRLDKVLKKIDFSKQISFVTGYVKGIDGIMRKFDRGYSDITFSKIAVLLKKKIKKNIPEVVIYKEFHLSSADPTIVGEKNTVVVGKTNYDVADQLADVGMEAIHPQASKPLEENGINLRVKNTFDPDHLGTLIQKNYIGIKAKVEIITGSKEMVLVEVHDPRMVGTVGFDKEISNIFSQHKISYVIKTTNANSISQVVWEKNLTPQLLKELKSRKYQSITVVPVAVVCVIGTNIAVPGILQKAAGALGQKGISVKCISQSLRQVNMQFVIEREHYEEAIRAINLAFLNKKN